jgi:hypothetical protein
MQLNLTTEQFQTLIQLVNTGIDNLPDDQLTDEILSVVAIVNQAKIFNPELA